MLSFSVPSGSAFESPLFPKSDRLPHFSQKPAASTRSVLVIDDDPRVLETLSLQLQNSGLDVVALQSPLEAVALCSCRRFSVILSDQQMAEMPGLECLRQIALIQP